MTGKKGGLLLIEVSVRKDEVKVSGHADFAKKGEDIICGAVSILTQNLVNSIQNLTQDKVACVIESGKVIINLDFGNLSEQTKTLIDSFFLGICSIADVMDMNIQSSMNLSSRALTKLRTLVTQDEYFLGVWQLFFLKIILSL